MFTYVYFTFCVLFGCVYAYPPENRIVGGSIAPENAYPYMASIMSLGQHICGGSIINERYVLTAASCVYMKDEKYMSVFVGSNRHSLGGQAYNVQEKIIHENYDTETFANDIALLYSWFTIQFNPRTQPIALATAPTSTGDKAIFTGWGRTSLEGPNQDVLMQLDIETLSYDECEKANIDEGHICSVAVTGQGACIGDNGAPLAEKKDGFVLIGLFSRGTPCGTGKSDVFTNIYYFKDWIESNSQLY